MHAIDVDGCYVRVYELAQTKGAHADVGQLLVAAKIVHDVKKESKINLFCPNYKQSKYTRKINN